MPQEISTFNYGSVNCYLMRGGDNFLLVDTGLPNKRTELEKALADMGCRPGNLRLILLTHGDYAHAGNADYFRQKFGCNVGMHAEDSGRVERGDWNWNLKPKPDRFLLMFRLISFFIQPGKFDTFKPDIYVEDGQSLLDCGIAARVVHLPGHTKGSIGVVTDGGELFCGDLMDSMRKPNLEFFINDMASARESVKKLSGLGITTVYPGHGRPFPWEQFIRRYH